jgi:hypothetical protein
MAYFAGLDVSVKETSVNDNSRGRSCGRADLSRHRRCAGPVPELQVKTGKALGLTIPESFLLRADELIE